MGDDEIGIEEVRIGLLAGFAYLQPGRRPADPQAHRFRGLIDGAGIGDDDRQTGDSLGTLASFWARVPLYVFHGVVHKRTMILEKPTHLLARFWGEPFQRKGFQEGAGEVARMTYSPKTRLRDPAPKSTSRVDQRTR